MNFRCGPAGSGAPPSLRNATANNNKAVLIPLDSNQVFDYLVSTGAVDFQVMKYYIGGIR